MVGLSASIGGLQRLDAFTPSCELAAGYDYEHKPGRQIQILPASTSISQHVHDEWPWVPTRAPSVSISWLAIRRLIIE